MQRILIRRRPFGYKAADDAALAFADPTLLIANAE
jgi:hypothetical protein